MYAAMYELPAGIAAKRHFYQNHRMLVSPVAYFFNEHVLLLSFNTLCCNADKSLTFETFLIQLGKYCPFIASIAFMFHYFVKYLKYVLSFLILWFVVLIFLLNTLQGVAIWFWPHPGTYMCDQYAPRIV